MVSVDTHLCIGRTTSTSLHTPLSSVFVYIMGNRFELYTQLIVLGCAIFTNAFSSKNFCWLDEVSDTDRQQPSSNRGEVLGENS